MEIRKEEYSKEFDTLLWRSDTPNPRPEYEYYAVRNKEGRLIAAGVCWKSRIHPERMRFFVSVAETHQGRGYGTAIFRRMQDDHEGEKWLGSADFENDEAEWWLRGLGFDFSHRTYWMDCLLPDFEEDGRYVMDIRSMIDMSREQRVRLLSMAWSDYARKREKYDPLNRAMDADEFCESVLGWVNLETSCCLMNGDEIDAYVLCSPGEDECSTAVLQTGQRLADTDQYRHFLVEFVNRTFEKVGELILQAESFDADAMMLMRMFGELPEDSYDSYILE